MKLGSLLSDSILAVMMMMAPVIYRYFAGYFMVVDGAMQAGTLADAIYYGSVTCCAPYWLCAVFLERSHSMFPTPGWGSVVSINKASVPLTCLPIPAQPLLPGLYFATTTAGDTTNLTSQR